MEFPPRFRIVPPRSVYQLPGDGSLVFSATKGEVRQHKDEEEWERRHVGPTVASRAEFDHWLRWLGENRIEYRVVDDERVLLL